MNNGKKQIGIIATLIIVVAIVIIAVIGMFRDSGMSQDAMDKEAAVAALETKLKKIDIYSEKVTPQQLNVSEFLDTADELPDIDTSYPMVVDGKSGSDYVNVEIFSSGEKAAKSGSDSFLTEMAKKFNGKNVQTSSGKIINISLRSVPSGTAVDYIYSGKYIPDGYTPSNELFGLLLEKNGVETEVINKRLVGNVAGILISKSKYKQLAEAGEVNAESVLQAVIDGKLSMGYSNPYTSATGINFLMTTLNTLSPNNILSDEAVSKFQAFQANIPLVSYTTQQMTSSADKGIIDALISEYQTYTNDSTLSRNFEFIPFGVRHDNPLYAVGNIDADKKEALAIFSDYCDENQKTASADGFNGLNEYVGNGSYTGIEVAEAQTIWKEEKSAGKTIVAEFVVDISGSMTGEPINNLRAAMVNTIQYINDSHQIGIIAFNSSVIEYLPIAEFDLTQKTLYKGAVSSLNAGGGTSMYDAVLVAIDKVNKKCQELGENAVPMIFVLTDGETNSGNSYRDVSSIIDGIDIPIYSISYNYNNDELGVLSNLNEASYINGTSEDITYKLKNLFNVEM